MANLALFVYVRIQPLKLTFIISNLNLTKSHSNFLPVLSAVLPDELVDGRHQPRVAVLDVNIDADVGEGPGRTREL